jgi:hypothetical protein
MIIGPRYLYRLAWHPALNDVEVSVPGAWLYGWGGKWLRPRHWKNKDGTWATDPGNVAWELRVSWDSGWLLSRYLEDHCVEHTVYPIGIRDEMFIMDPEWLYAYGQALTAHGLELGELRDTAGGQRNTLTTYQTRNMALGATRPKVYDRWAGGGGKSVGLCVAALPVPGPILVLCPAKARKSWRWRPENKRPRSLQVWTGVERFTHWESHVILPENERYKGYEPLPEYWARMIATGRRPVVVAGLEALDDHVEALLRYPWAVIGIDEIHTLGSHKRVDWLTDAEGNDYFKRSKTKAGDDLQVLAADRMLTSKTVQLRVGLSGSPIDKSVRRLWSQGDLLQKGSLGPYSAFRVRYCDYHKGQDGRWDDSGAARVDELKARFSFFTYDLPRTVTHAELPPFRPNVAYLAPPDRLDVPEEERQNRPDAFAGEMKTIAKTGGNIREVKLAVACSSVRRATLKKCEEVLSGGGKCVIFLCRKEMVARWAKSFQDLGYPGHAIVDPEKIPPELVGKLTCTVGYSEKDRDAAIDEFASADGPRWLLATGYSIGTSKDGMQCADLLVIAQLPEKIGDLLQWMWRVDRIGGRGAEVWIPVAEGTQAEIEVSRIVRAIGPIEQFTNSPELRELADRFDGGEFESVLTGAAEKFGAGGGHGPTVEVE